MTIAAIPTGLNMPIHKYVRVEYYIDRTSDRIILLPDCVCFHSPHERDGMLLQAWIGQLWYSRNRGTDRPITAWKDMTRLQFCAYFSEDRNLNCSCHQMLIEITPARIETTDVKKMPVFFQALDPGNMGAIIE
jgi:hypothetical protein